MGLLAKWRRLPPGERALTVEAAICLAIARLLLLLPFRLIKRLFARRPAPPPGLNAADADRVRATGRALRRAARRLPWNSECFVQALAGRMMLGRRRLGTVIHIGVHSDEAQGFRSSSAWVAICW